MKSVLWCLIVLCAVLVMPVVKADDGHYETRSRTVLICGPHYEQVWVEPLFRGQRLIQVGYWRECYVPARYERRLVQVWIPECRGGGALDLHINWNWHTW